MKLEYLVDMKTIVYIMKWPSLIVKTEKLRVNKQKCLFSLYKKWKKVCVNENKTFRSIGSTVF